MATFLLGAVVTYISLITGWSLNENSYMHKTERDQAKFEAFVNDLANSQKENNDEED